MRRLAILTLLAVATLSADIQYMVDYLLPRGGGRGSVVEVTFHGRSLENPREILFYQPGIKASSFSSLPKPGEGFKVRFQIAPDCQLGEHVLRVRTADALSDAVTFWVSPFPTVYESESKIGENDSVAKAKPVPLNSTVEGQILPGPDMDRDFYRVEVKEGQRISVEVEAVRLGTLHFGGENDLAVRILDPDGKELGKNDDSTLYVQDPVLSVIAPRTGSYFVEIYQQVFTPPRQAWYRAHLGSFSRPTAIFPTGGEAGKTLDARILGDPAGERTEPIALPDKPGNFNYFAGSVAERPPSPNVLRVSPYPNVLWSGTANTPATLPAALNGVFDKPGETHTYQFAAKKGQAWKVRVFARALGAPVDARVWIRTPKDAKHILDADDSRLVDLGLPSSRGTWHIKEQMDPVAIFRVPADGDYILGVEDSTNAAGPDHVYRVEIEPLRDTIYTHITAPDGYQVPRLTGLVVPQGNRWTLDVQLAEGLGNTYKGEMALEAVGLPRGVTMIAPHVTKGVTRIPVQFVASPDAEPQAVLIDLLARPVDGKTSLDSGSRQGFALVNQAGEMPWHFVFLDKYALAVTEPAPFHLELEQPGIPLAQSSELQLKVKVIRSGDFKGAIEMQPDWLPPGVSKGATVTIPADHTEGTFTIQANDKAAPGIYRVAINASTAGTGDAASGVGRIRVSSEFVELKVSEPYLSIDVGRSSVEQGKAGEIVGVIKQNRPFPGKATVTLRQLPKGVKLLNPAPQITSQDTAVVFHVAAEKDALAGLYKGVGCEIAFTEDGQTIRQQTGSGVLRIDAPRTAEVSK
jgi:hypothetical protein